MFVPKISSVNACAIAWAELIGMNGPRQMPKNVDK